MDEYGTADEVTPPPASIADGKKPAGGSISAMPPPSPPPGGVPMGYPVFTEPPRPPTKYPQIAGVLLIITALILVGYSYVLFMTDAEDYAEETTRSFQFYSDSDGTVTLTGVVTDVDDEPIEGVFINVVHPDQLETRHRLNATTDSNGTYEIEKVPTGKKLVTVSGENYTTIRHKIFVEADIENSRDEIELSFIMEKGTGVTNTGSYKSEIFDFINAFLTVCGSLFLIAAVMALIGAVFSFLRKRYYVVIIGCIFGILFGLSLIIGTILSIIAFYMIVKSKAEFKKRDSTEITSDRVY
jgi:hypothetical protein